MAPVLCYWNVRGLCSRIKYLLEYVGVAYEDKQYNCGPPPDFDRGDWIGEKFNLGLDFPNLPYYIDEDVKLTQSVVILHYLARKYGLDGKNDADKLRAELLESQIQDLHMAYARICYNPDFEKLKEDYRKGLPDQFKLLSKFLGDRKFVVGDYITYADFLLFEYLECQTYFDASVIADFPNLKEFHARILALEPIKKYFESSRCIKFPFNGAPAYFGGPYSDVLSKSKQ